MFSLRKPYYFKYFCFARFGFRQPPLGRPSEGTPEPPHRAPPGPLRMLKNDEVLPFSGACHFFPARSVYFLLSHSNIPTFSFALLSLFPVSSSPFKFHFLFSPCYFLMSPLRSTRFPLSLDLLLISLPPIPRKVVLAP